MIYQLQKSASESVAKTDVNTNT